MVDKKSAVAGVSEVNSFRRFIYESIGLYYPENRLRDLKNHLLLLTDAAGYLEPADYIRFLKNQTEDHPEIRRLVSQLTVGETYFFRDDHQIKVLKEEILPALISRENVNGRNLRIWSAGCASGEEPYTLAMMVKGLIPYLSQWQIDILATDINHLSLQKAKAARYAEWSFRNTDAKLKRRYFTKDDNQYQLADEIRSMVNFAYLNLIDRSFPSPANRTNKLNLILCRNVFIYFDKDTIRSLIDMFFDCLSDRGWLVTGASDPIINDSRFSIQEIGGVFAYHKEVPVKRRPAPSCAVKTSGSARLVPEVKWTVDVVAEARPSSELSKSAYEQGLEFYRSGDFERALLLFTEGFEQMTSASKCAYMIAKVKADQSFLGQAEEWCGKAIAVDKLMSEAYYLLAVVLLGGEKDDEAVDALKRAIYINRDYAEAHYCLGTIYQKQGKIIGAKKAFENAENLISVKRANNREPAGATITDHGPRTLITDKG